MAQIHDIRASSDPITLTQVYVCTVTTLTIVLWCLAHSYEGTFGDMGIIAIIPLIAFFGTGLLTKDDFNNFLWNVIILAMGGIALGKAVESSGLLHTIATEIEEMVTGMSAFEVLFVFSCLVLVIATFISHTVAALIVLPIVAEVGARLDDPHPRLLVMVKNGRRARIMTMFNATLGNGIHVLCSHGITGIWIPQHECHFAGERVRQAISDDQGLFAERGTFECLYNALRDNSRLRVDAPHWNLASLMESVILFSPVLIELCKQSLDRFPLFSTTLNSFRSERYEHELI